MVMLFKVFLQASRSERVLSKGVGGAIVPPLQDVISCRFPELVPEKIELDILFSIPRSPVPRVLVVIDALPDIFLHSQAGLVDVRDHQIHLHRKDSL